MSDQVEPMQPAVELDDVIQGMFTQADPVDVQPQVEEPATAVPTVNENPGVAVFKPWRRVDEVLAEHPPVSQKNEDNHGNPGKPLMTARVATTRLFNVTGGGLTRPGLQFWRKCWYMYDVKTGNWYEVDATKIRIALYGWLEYATFWADKSDKSKNDGANDDSNGTDAGDGDGSGGGFEEVQWNPSISKLMPVVDALMLYAERNDDLEINTWSSDRAPEWATGAVIPVRNGLLNVDDETIHRHDPYFFNLNSLPYNYDPTAKCEQWETWLRSILDDETVMLLQEWAGYTVSGCSDIHKALFLVGPTRSGKSVFTKILRALVGDKNTVGPRMSSLSSGFGLQSWIGKTLAVFDDVRLPHDSNKLADMMENILSLTSNASQTFDRKNLPAITLKLGTKIIFVSNDLLKFKDPSGAMPNRLLTAEFTESFLDREDIGLEDRLRTELPGILNWALVGLRRLYTNNKQFTRPQAAQDAHQEMLDGSNYTVPFAREYCQVGPRTEHAVTLDELFDLYEALHGSGFDNRTGAKTSFGNRLNSGVPGLNKKKWQVTIGDGPRKSYTFYQGISLRPEYQRCGNKYAPTTPEAQQRQALYEQFYQWPGRFKVADGK